MNGKSRGRLTESEASESDHIVSRENDSKATSYPDKYVLLCQNNCSSVHDKCALFKEIQYWKESCPYELQFTSSSQVLRWESPTIFTTKSFTRKLQEFVIAQRTVSQLLVSTFQTTTSLNYHSPSNEKMNHSRLFRKYRQFLRINFHKLSTSLTRWRWLTVTPSPSIPRSTDYKTTIWRRIQENTKIQQPTDHMFAVTMGELRYYSL